MTYNNAKSLKGGFTIVELLIVIVVIAILAAITIISYNGISTRARQTAMQSNIEQVAKQIENYKTINSAYPATLGLINNGQGPKKGQDAQFAYTLSGGDYCLTIGSTASSMTYNISNTTGRTQEGYCAGHTVASFSSFPVRLGYQDFSTATGSGDTLVASIGSVPTGSWMIVILAYTNSADTTPPSGWTTLVTRKTTNTMQTSIYAKVKDVADNASQAFEGAGTNGETTTNGLLLWGANAAPFNEWTLGSFGDRFTNATSTSAITPTLSVSVANSLVLSIAVERTAATETNYVSMTGASAWAWVPQVDANKIQTIAVGYNEQEAIGTSTAMTIVYPNSQTYNATAVQIAIPPSN